MRSISKTRQHLEALQQQFPVDEALGVEPVLLAKTDTNARAFAHTMRLASLDFPLAFAKSHKSFRVEKAEACFKNALAETHATGKNHRLMAGVLIKRRLSSAWDMDAESSASIGFLFRLREEREPQLKGVGKRLLRHVLGDLTAFDVVDLQVVASNKPAVELYEQVGFKPVSLGRSPDDAHKVVTMCLRGGEIAAAHTLLQSNQL
jgi:ribosomal protein S18 acetylase RimI-like enzyme